MLVADELSFPQSWGQLTGKRVLDIGCGTGRHTRRLVAQHNDVLGVDPSPGMLALARQRLRGQRVDFVQDDFLTLEVPALPFDAAIASLVLEHIADLGSFFARAAAAIAPGGELFVSEIHPWRAARGGLAHFRDEATHAEVFLRSYLHDDAAMMLAATHAGFSLLDRGTIHGTAELAQMRNGWQKYVGQPMLQLWAWRRSLSALAAEAGAPRPFALTPD